MFASPVTFRDKMFAVVTLSVPTLAFDMKPVCETFRNETLAVKMLAEVKFAVRTFA